MSDINYVILIGRLTGDPTYKVIGNGNTLSTFTLANNRKYKKQSGELSTETNYINCTAWGKLSDFIRNYLKKGMQIAVEGRLKQNRWQTEDGKNVSSIDIVVNNIQILTPKSTNVSANQSSEESESPQIEDNHLNSALDSTDDDIPF